MSSIVQTALEKLVATLTGGVGLKQSFAELGQPSKYDELSVVLLTPAKVATAEFEKAGRYKYPVVLAYCVKVTNGLKERFQRFSGTIDAVLEIQVSADRADQLAEALYELADVMGDTIGRCRGPLGDGYYLPGSYEIRFDAPKPGGLHFVQAAQIYVPIAATR